MDFTLDKIGFDLIDTEYQKERAERRAEIELEVNEEFGKYRYSGGPTDREDKKKEEVRKQEIIEQRFNEVDQRLQRNHFGEGGRDAALKMAQEEEQKQFDAREQKRKANELQNQQKEQIREQEQLKDKFNEAARQQEDQQKQDKNKKEEERRRLDGLRKQQQEQEDEKKEERENERVEGEDQAQKLAAYKLRMRERFNEAARKQEKDLGR